MKVPSTTLHDLVKTLTKSEKRYIKIQAGTQDKDYLHLLDALVAQEIYDEQQLIKDHKGAKFLNHLAVSKRYLYDLLLKLLTQFNQKAVEDKVQRKIDAVKVLVEKNLLKAASSELRKGQKIAVKYELFSFQLQLSGLQKTILSRQPVGKRKEELIRKVFEVEREQLQQLQNTNEYWYLTQQMAQFQTRFQKIQNEEQQQYIQALTTTDQFQDSTLATNFKSQLYFYQANAIYQFMQGDVKAAYDINSQFLDLLEANEHFMQLYAQRYLATLNNMLIDSLVIGEYEVLQEGIDRLVKTVERPEFKSIKNIEARVFRQRYLLLINWSLSQQDFGKAKAWIPEIEQGLKQFGHQIERHHRITFYYLLAYLLFQNKRFDDALQWNNLLLNDPKEDVVKEIFHFSRILNLLIHYELGNHTLLESLLLSTPKYLRARRAIYATEKALFQVLGKLLRQVDRKAKQKLMLNFKSEITLLFENPREKRVFNYLDLRLWGG